MRTVNLHIAAAVCVLIMTLTLSAIGRTIYVDHNGSADFTSIQAAIDDANDGDEIEVTAGTYNEAIDFKGKAIQLYSSGGPEVTIIDANGLNSSVIKCESGEDADTVLEGFTITGGNTTYGGGMYNYNSSPEVSNCTFSGNSAAGGGGVCNSTSSSPKISNCTFSSNESSNVGGGMYNYNSNTTVTNCTFSSNTAIYYGGGMYNYDNSAPTVTNCTFSDNSTVNGGGVCNSTSSNPTMTNCTFSSNETTNLGGGMYNYDSSPTVTGCSFAGNSAASAGGGLCNSTSSNPKVKNCIFRANTSNYGGGINNYDNSAPTVTNCTFSGNSAVNGGGVCNSTSSNPTMTNCTFSNNESSNVGGGMYNYNSNPTVINCILWDNTPDEISNNSSSPDVTYSDVKGGYGGTGNIDADPFFVDADANDLRLISSASPCVDTGNNSAASLPATDLAGNPRIVDGDRDGTATVDMGAYEFQYWLVHNITQDLWYAIIQASIDDANNGDEIEVAAGTYYEAIDFKGKAVRLYSNSGPDVTTINANGAYHVVQCISGEGPDTILEGFTITGGNANGVVPDNRGGGMYCESSSPTVTGCTFSGNYAGDGGGVCNITFSSPTMTNCTFGGNSAQYDGGGIYNKNYSNPKLTNCIISNNSASYGGGMYNSDNSNPTLTNCTFSNNSANNYGGGLINNGRSRPTAINCILWDNTPDQLNDWDSPDSTTTVSFSDVQGGWSGMENIDEDPCFVDSAGGDLRLLSSASPCVDAGDNSAPNLPATDLLDNPRVVDGDRDGTATVDMGAYELQDLAIHNITQDCWYDSIQISIDDAYYGDQIEVGPGTYYEAINFNGKSIRLYSSGGPDVTTIDGTGNYHVVRCVNGEDANTVLEGFTITGGNANGTGSNNRGGGMLNWTNSNPKVNNCTFSGNSASGSGGGMYNYESSAPTVTNCTFSGNEATYKGGGLYNYKSSPTVTNCTFSNNTAYDGGGMVNQNSSPTVKDCNFTDNTASAYGGGMENHNGGNPTVTNCTFSNNSADHGGGMLNDNSSPMVTNCTFSTNIVVGNGGGMYNITDSSPTVTNCIFGNNSAAQGGGLMNNGSSLTVTNCTFSCNTASVNGGGMFNSYSSPKVTNCTFSGNQANYGGGMYNYNNSSPTVTNCILWGNSPDQINDWDSPASTTTVSFSDVQGGWPGMLVMDLDPLFVNAAGGDLRLSSNASPCVDTGAMITPGLPATDLAGNPRIVDGDRNGTAIVDMGAYEYQSWLIHNITQDIWSETIQAAIDTAAKGDEIEVPPGTYYEAIDFNGKSIRLYSTAGPNDTTIDGSGHYHVVRCVNGEDANTVLEGFTITGGKANGPDPNDKRGGGMYCVSSSPTVTGCIFTGNLATVDGGAMHNSSSSPTVIKCIFSGNSAYRNGAGMYNEGSSPTVSSCSFIDNNSTNSGGGMSNWGGSPTVTDCTFTTNSVNQAGGGMSNWDSSPTVTDCNFTDNITSVDGGGIFNYGGSPTVTNCNFRNNTAAYGGGMYNTYTYSSSPTVTNCTFSCNTASVNGGGIYNNNNSSPTVTNCTFGGNSAEYDGGGMYNYEISNPTLTNCTFSTNIVIGNGGGMFNNYSSPKVTNCTFSSNQASYGGGMNNYSNSNPTVTNCILWDNSPNEIHDDLSSSTVSYSDIQGGRGGKGNIDADPCFVQSGYWADANDPNIVVEPNSPNSIWIDGDYRLRPGSPCIDAGDNNSVPADTTDLDDDGDINEPIPFDLGGLPRFVDDLCTVDTGNPGTMGPTVVDMGAYERLAADIDENGAVDVRDLCEFALHWGETDCGRCGGADMTCDGDVDWNDLRELVAHWLAGTEPEL